MRKVKTVEVPVTTIEATTKQIVQVFCDVPDCDEPIQPFKYGWGKVGHKCLICDRDICRRHTVEDPDDGGDYPDKWCSICHGLYYQKRRVMYDRHDKEETELLENVKRESLNVTKIKPE
jgi:hypothetical protein